MVEPKRGIEKPPPITYVGWYHCLPPAAGGEPPLLDQTIQPDVLSVLMFHFESSLTHLSAKPPLRQPFSASLAYTAIVLAVLLNRMVFLLGQLRRLPLTEDVLSTPSTYTLLT